jgi:hypothetical protein
MHQNISGNNDAAKGIRNSDGSDVSVQYPLSVDGDSVYNKDVNFDLSSAVGFTGDLTSVFGDYETEIVNATATNPKILVFRFERPVTSNKIGIGAKTGDFSNVNILLKDLAGTVRQFFDDSANDTKLTSNLYEFTSNTFIEAFIEFHTADTITISGMFIPKAQERHISAIDGIISVRNSSLVPLGAGAVFTGEQEDTKNYGMIQCALFSDVDCTFEIFFRSTPSSTWRLGDIYEVAAGEDKVWSFQAARRLMRVIVTNGPGAQSEFDLQTILKPVYVKPSSHPIGGTIKGNDDAELVKSQITGERPDGDYGNVTVTNGNNLKQSLEEFDDIFNSLPLPVVDAILHGSKGVVTGLNKVNKYGRAIDGVQVTMTDIWDRADAAATQQIWLAPTAARIHTIVSTAAADDGTPEGAGVGAQAVRVWYLPDWDTKEAFEDVILNGVAGVAMNNAAVIIHRMKVIPVGTTYAINAGNITATAAVDATVTAQINIGQGQTNMAIYGIPSVQKAYLTGYIINAHETANPGTAVEVDFNMIINERPDLITTAFLNKSNLGIRTTGSTAPYRPFNPYKEVEGPAIIKFQADATAADIEGVAEFDAWLVDN